LGSPPQKGGADALKSSAVRLKINSQSNFFYKDIGMPLTGSDQITFDIELSPFMRIKATEGGGGCPFFVAECSMIVGNHWVTTRRMFHRNHYRFYQI